MQNPISPSQRRALWALSLAYFVQATGALSVAGSLAAVSHEWGLSDGQSARLLSIFGLTFALAAPLAQIFFGHLTRKYQVLAGMLVFGLGALLFAMAADYPMLIAWRFADWPGTGGARRGVSGAARTRQCYRHDIAWCLDGEHGGDPAGRLDCYDMGGA